MFDKSRDVFEHLINPIQFLYMAASYIPGTIFSLISSLQLGVLFSPSAFVCSNPTLT
jgi:hypothetical protein